VDKRQGEGSEDRGWSANTFVKGGGKRVRKVTKEKAGGFKRGVTEDGPPESSSNDEGEVSTTIPVNLRGEKI